MSCGQNVGLRLVGLFGLLVNNKSDSPSGLPFC
jgi:hypothetical protein